MTTDELFRTGCRAVAYGACVVIAMRLLWALVPRGARAGGTPGASLWPCDVPCPVCKAAIGRWCGVGVAHLERYEASAGALRARGNR